MKLSSRCIVPIVHADGSLEARQLFWEAESPEDFEIDPRALDYIFVHENVPITDRIIRAADVDLAVSGWVWKWWCADNLEELLRSALTQTYGLDSISRLEEVEGVGVFLQTSVPNDLVTGCTASLEHGQDYDPNCSVCVQHTEIVKTILNDWIRDAIFVERDWQEQDCFVIKNTRRIVILKPSKKHLIERIGDWFVENFSDTIKLAAIDTIHFQEPGTENCHTVKIDYGHLAEQNTLGS